MTFAHFARRQLYKSEVRKIIDEEPKVTFFIFLSICAQVAQIMCLWYL